MPIRLQDSAWSSAIGTLAEAITQAPMNRAKVREMELRQTQAAAEDARAQAMLEIQQAQEARAAALQPFELQKLQGEIASKSLADEFAIKKQPFELGKLESEFNSQRLKTGLEAERIQSMPGTEEAVTEAVFQNVQQKMPEWNLLNSLSKPVPPPPPEGYLPGVEDAGANYSSEGMDALAQRDAYRTQIYDQIGTMAHGAVLDENFDAGKFITDTTKALTTGSGGYRPATPAEKAAFGVPSNAPLMMTPDGKPDMISGTQNNVSVGTIPPGMRLVTDPQTNSMRFEPIPGSKAEMDAAALAEKKDAQTQQRMQSADIVSQDIDRSLKILDNDTWYNPATGFGSGLAANWSGTNSSDLRGLSDTIGASISFDTLQQLREASPTGGALGAVSDREILMLRAAKGNIENSQSEEQLRYNLNRLWNLYQDTIHGPGMGPPRRPLDGSRGQGPGRIKPEDIDLLKQDPSPDAITEFNYHYGDGAAEQILGGN